MDVSACVLPSFAAGFLVLDFALNRNGKMNLVVAFSAAGSFRADRRGVLVPEGDRQDARRQADRAALNAPQVPEARLPREGFLQSDPLCWQGESFTLIHLVGSMSSHLEISVARATSDRKKKQKYRHVS